MRPDHAAEDPFIAPSPAIKQRPRLLGLSESVWAHAALLFVSVTFSGMNVLVQQALPESKVPQSIVFSFLRDAIASPILTIAMVLTRQYVAPRRRDLLKLLVGLGVIGMSCNQTFCILGIDFVGGDMAALYNCIGPAIMFLMSLSLSLEKFSSLKLLGVVSGGIGIVFVSELWDVSFSRENMLLGHLFLFLGICASQLFTIIQKFIHGYPDLMVVTVAYWAAVATISVPTLILSLTHTAHENIWPTSLFEWGVVIYSGAISSALNYYLLVFATMRLTPLIVSMYGVTQPIITDIFNYLFVGEGMSGWDGLGSCFIVFSVLITTYAQARLDAEQKTDLEGSEVDNKVDSSDYESGANQIHDQMHAQMHGQMHDQMHDRS